jgi:thiol-disulfide isomerase/thioredoxin
MKKVKCTFWLILILGGIDINAQTQYLKGQITSYTGKSVMKAHLAQFDGNSFKEDTSTPVDAGGKFEIRPRAALSSSECLLWFDSGDTISFIAGSDKYLEFMGRWYEGTVIEPRFTNSDENKLFFSIKEKVKWFRSVEDSLNRAARGIDEYDPRRTARSLAINESFVSSEVRYNQQLRELQHSQSQSYCSKAIIPVLFLNNQNEDTIVGLRYDSNKSFQHYEFFGLIKPDSLIATNLYLREKIREYMDIWVNQRDKGLSDGVDEVMKKFSPDGLLGKYALATLVDYFTSHNNYPLIDYLYANYFNTCEVPVLSGKSAQVIEQIKRLSPGNTAPELAMPGINGNYFLLSQMKPRKYVVLFFWASWCPHCQKIMPEVLNYYHDMKSKGVDFVAISLDNKKEEWLDYINKNKLDWINISDLRRYDSEAVSLYALKGTPTFYVIDASMKIVGRTNDLSGLNQFIK